MLFSIQSKLLLTFNRLLNILSSPTQRSLPSNFSPFLLLLLPGKWTKGGPPQPSRDPLKWRCLGLAGRVTIHQLGEEEATRKATMDAAKRKRRNCIDETTKTNNAAAASATETMSDATVVMKEFKSYHHDDGDKRRKRESRSRRHDDGKRREKRDRKKWESSE